VSVRKEDLLKLIDSLDSEDKKAAFDFIHFLSERSKKKPLSWQKIDERVPDDEPLTKEELEQMESDEGYVSGEDVKREFGLQVDLL
jgi:hypothetical protein